MVATPAWPPSSLPRLFVPALPAGGGTIELDGPAAHYLSGVLRLGPGDQVKLFDDVTGEYLAELVETGRRKAVVRIGPRLRAREEVPDFWLAFAPIKRGRIDWLVEKATEIGVARLIPVITERTIVDRVNVDRLRAHAVEAAEQCDRTSLPLIDEPRSLKKLLDDWPEERALHFADETGGRPLAEAARPAPAALLVGPEGGFTDAERARIADLPSAVPVSLGPRILRADTAALAAASLWMAAQGDWSRAPSR